MGFVAPQFYTPNYQNGLPKLAKDHLLLHVLYLKTVSAGIVLQTKDHCILVDLSMGLGTDIIKNYLLLLGIETIDIIVLTHPHDDHIAFGQDGLLRFTTNFEVKKIWSNGSPYPKWYDNVTDCPDTADSRMAYGLVLSQIFPDGYTVMGEGVVPSIQGNSVIPYEEPRKGNATALGDITITALYPENVLKSVSTNNNSMVLKIEYQGKSILLPSDILDTAETDILSTSVEQLKADVLCLAHHGYDSNNDTWLDAVNPDIAVVQGDSVIPRIITALNTRGIPLHNPFSLGRHIAVDLSVNKIEAFNNHEYNWQAPIF